MQILNFTCEKIRHKLLNRTKQQTIRPGWKITSVTTEKREISSKGPRFRINERVKVMWNQKCKHRTFCKDCGKPVKGQITLLGFNAGHEDCGCSSVYDKDLGTVKIIKIFKILMWKDERGVQMGGLDVGDDKFIEDIAHRDGFENTQDMYEWFDMMYRFDSIPRPFWVYRWDWI